MTEYEIRILGSDGRPTLISEWFHLNVNAAINSAKRMANGAAFEVDRRQMCLRPTAQYKSAYEAGRFEGCVMAGRRPKRKVGPSANVVEYHVVPNGRRWDIERDDTFTGQFAYEVNTAIALATFRLM